MSGITSRITNKIIRRGLNDGIVNSATGFTIGVGLGLGRGDSFSDAMQEGLSGAATGFATGAITGASIELGTKFTSQFEQKKLTPYEKGKMGVERAMREFEENGGEILAQEVTIEINGTRIRLDFIGKKDGQLYLFEVKNGPYARPTPNQGKAIPLLKESHEFIPIGKNALRIDEFKPFVNSKKPYTGNYLFKYQHYK